MVFLYTWKSRTYTLVFRLVFRRPVAKPPLTLLLAPSNSLRPFRKITASIVLEPLTRRPGHTAGWEAGLAGEETSLNLT